MAVSSDVGIESLFKDCMKAFPVLISSRVLGGRYTGFPLGLCSLMIWFRVVRVESGVELKSVDFTYLVGFM